MAGRARRVALQPVSALFQTYRSSPLSCSLGFGGMGTSFPVSLLNTCLASSRFAGSAMPGLWCTSAASTSFGGWRCSCSDSRMLFCSTLRQSTSSIRPLAAARAETPFWPASGPPRLRSWPTWATQLRAWQTPAGFCPGQAAPVPGVKRTLRPVGRAFLAPAGGQTAVAGPVGPLPAVFSRGQGFGQSAPIQRLYGPPNRFSWPFRWLGHRPGAWPGQSVGHALAALDQITLSPELVDQACFLD